MATAQLQVSVNGGAPQTGGIDVPSAATLQFSAVSTVGWTQQRWEIIDYPEGWATPSGWTLRADGVIYSTSVTPTLITLPANTVQWGCWCPQLLINEQLASATDLGTGLLDKATRLTMLSPSGQRDIGALEEGQFCTTTTLKKQWLRSYQRNLRTLEGTAVVATSNATPVYVVLATLAVGDVRQVDVIAKVAKADGTVRQTFKLSALYYGAAGPTATIDGSITTTATGTGAAAVTLDLSGATVRLKITGIAATSLTTTYQASVF
jgi:hypothetical protein